MDKNPTSGLRALTNYKNKILEAIISDDLLVRAVANSEVNALDIEVENPGDLLYKQIFPFKWVAEDVPDKKETYLTMSFRCSKTYGNVYFNDIVFMIYVFAHKDIMRLYDGQTHMLRTDFIMERLEKIFDGSKDFGLGSLALVDMGDAMLSMSITGTYLTFETVEQA